MVAPPHPEGVEEPPEARDVEVPPRARGVEGPPFPLESQIPELNPGTQWPAGGPHLPHGPRLGILCRARAATLQPLSGLLRLLLIDRQRGLR